MCVIIVKPSGAEMPSKAELKRAYSCNHDGMGFVSENDYYKGLNFDEFYKRLKRVPKEENCIIHFRLATHGSIKRSNCHPFTDGKGIFFAHNGILNIEADRDKTDSETAFRRYLLPSIYKYGIESPQTSLLVKSLIGYSKFAFMTQGHVTLFGAFQEHGGCYYSNLRHLRINTIAI